MRNEGNELGGQIGNEAVFERLHRFTNYSIIMEKACKSIEAIPRPAPGVGHAVYGRLFTHRADRFIKADEMNGFLAVEAKISPNLSALEAPFGEHEV